ncbi:hypothetical protein E8E13_006122 [Curvularia kusanoi]|uniref:Uncharacterized protein n=1 Tax=Curvularia kusanoi TaxID=90978 RepID=A0A9P4W613_CURKU|nr:hypothetical protein E8E13_006122 [Curvularia kusanoi]
MSCGLCKLFSIKAKKDQPVELVTLNRRIRYASRPALEQFLTEKCGNGNYLIEMKEDQWVIKIPKDKIITDMLSTNGDP